MDWTYADLTQNRAIRHLIKRIAKLEADQVAQKAEFTKNDLLHRVEVLEAKK